MSGSKKKEYSDTDAAAERNIDYSEIPELPDSFWDNAHIEYPESKKPVTLRMDRDVLEWFKAKGKGYQTRINAVLRTYMEAHKR
jgi:uncharacterized protein (DUF4415 family)